MATITSVQSNTLSQNSSSPFSVTLGSGVTQGNLLVACFEEGNNATITGPAGWSQAGSFQGIANWVGAAVWYAVVTAGMAGQTSWSFSFSSGSHSSGMTIREWNSSTGWSTAGVSGGPLDQATGSTGTSSTTVATGSTAATTQAQELVVASLAYASTPLTESGLTSGYTSGNESTATSGPNTGREAYQVTSASGVQACQMTISSSSHHAAAIATFMPASGAAAQALPAVIQAPYQPPRPPAAQRSQVILAPGTVIVPETSPGLELYGFGSFSALAGCVINSVTVTVTEHQSSTSQAPCTFQLWDYSGAPAQIGATQVGNPSTSGSNTSTAVFTGVTFAQLATLRVRVYGNANSGSGNAESVDAVCLTVNYTGTPAVVSGTAQALRYSLHSAIPGILTLRRRQNPELVPQQVVAVPPPSPTISVHERGKPPWFRKATEAWTVPVQPPFPSEQLRPRYRPPWPRRGTLPQSQWPVPVQPPETSEWMHPRFTRMLLFRRGNVAPTGWPVPVQPPNIPDGLRFVGPRRHFLRSGVVAPTGWPIPVQPPERMQAVRRWSRPLWPRKGVTEIPVPPQVPFNPPISWSKRRYSRPLWPRRGVVAPTGWPVPVQPPERMQSVRRWSRPLLPRKGVTNTVVPPPPVTILPFVPPPQRRLLRPFRRFASAIEPSPLPPQITVAVRIHLPEPGRPHSHIAQVPTVFIQPPTLPDSERRIMKLRRFRRGTAVPGSGLPVPVQPPNIPRFLRRWIRPLLPRRGITEAPLPRPVILVVKVPIFAWIRYVAPQATITLTSPFAFITVSIPLENELEG